MRMGTKKPCTDHLGKEYPSVPDMCAAYGIPESTYHGRLSRKWTQEQALTVPTGGNGPKVNPKGQGIARDHLGQEFISIGAMCRHWGISEKVYWSRKRICRWPLDKILTEPVRERDDTANAVAIKDHLGRPFKSISAMCRHWKIGLSTYRERRKRHWTVEQALTGTRTEIRTDAVECMDHLGNPYPSKNAMCAAYGITRYCYDSRLKLGWDQARALTEPHVINAKPCEDHTGKQFPASVYMALYLGFPKYAFHRTDAGLAGLVPKLAAEYWQDRRCGDCLVKRCVSFPWFTASHRGQDIMLSFGQILDIYHNSPEFRPLPDTGVKSPSVSVIKPIRWPWYLCKIKDAQAVLSYDALVDLHASANFGMSDPRPNPSTIIGE